jgi:16S rRNA (guanine527-N7)-methyltransferase
LNHAPTTGDSGQTVSVSRETRDRLDAFAALLARWNRRINLLSSRDLPCFWERHIADSLQLIDLLDPPRSCGMDIGSGAGFPGLILAIATGIPFDLIEADQRKASFLREAARVTAAPARVHPIRAEVAQLPLSPLVTARAVASLPSLLTLAAPLLAPGGICLFPKGTGANSELTLAESKWQMRVERFPSRTDPSATILRISEIALARQPG